MCGKTYFVCATLVLLCCLTLSHAAWLRCYKGSLDNYLVTPLNNPLVLTNSSCIDYTLPTVVYTFGYRGRVSGPATTAVLSAYIATKKRNVILLDWEEEARSGVLGISLGYGLHAVPNAKTVGNELGESLVKLAQAGLNMTQIHLLGHSLGAHVMAFAGRRARKKGYVVSRITGLDPARILFEGTLSLYSGLDRTCARFVDIVHSDPGGYGTSIPAGTVDIWPNYSGNDGTQPGCPDGTHDLFTKEDLCSHDRSWQYFVEAISSPTSFPAIAADNYDNWLTRRTRSLQTIYLGDLINPRSQGNFFLTTNAQRLYGRGQDGLAPDINQARRRRNSPSPLTSILKYFR